MRSFAAILLLLCQQDAAEEEKSILAKQADIKAFLGKAKTERDLRAAVRDLKSLSDRAEGINKYELASKLLRQAVSTPVRTY